MSFSQDQMYNFDILRKQVVFLSRHKGIITRYHKKTNDCFTPVVMQPAKIGLPELNGVAAMSKEEATASRSRLTLTASLSLLIISCKLPSHEITLENILKTVVKSFYVWLCNAQTHLTEVCVLHGNLPQVI